MNRENTYQGNSRLQLCLTVLKSLVLIALAALTVESATSQPLCTANTLQQADLAFGFGRFSSTFSTLSPCLPDGFTNKSEAVQAYRLMALAYVATDSLALARSSIRQLMKFDSSYRADPSTEPQIYVEMVNAQIPAWYSYMWRGNSAVNWLARGATIGAMIAFPVLIKGNTAPDLPGPPALPEN